LQIVPIAERKKPQFFCGHYACRTTHEPSLNGCCQRTTQLLSLDPCTKMITLGALKIGWKTCPYCGADEVYRSRKEPLTWLDQKCGWFLLRLVRCRQCELRHYRPIFFPAPQYPHPIRGQKSAQASADENSKRSA
jgi:hypothetical protein